MSEWRTIDSAPENGVKFLYYDADIDMGIAVGYKNNLGVVDEVFKVAVKPTHWMPLPNPPEEAPNE